MKEDSLPTCVVSARPMIPEISSIDIEGISFSFKVDAVDVVGTLGPESGYKGLSRTLYRRI